MLIGSLNITLPFSCHSVAWMIFFSDDFSSRIWVRLIPHDWQKVTWTQFTRQATSRWGYNIPFRLVSVTAWITTVNGAPFFCNPLFLSAPLCVHFALSAASAGHRASRACVEKQKSGERAWKSTTASAGWEEFTAPETLWKCADTRDGWKARDCLSLSLRGQCDEKAYWFGIMLGFREQIVNWQEDQRELEK